MMDGMMSGPQDLVGQEIDQFLIEKHIARGGMADLYLARDVKLARRVALKVVLPALAQMPEFTARFQREARATARINHPNVVQIYTNGLGPGGRPYIALEYISGGSLADRLAELHRQNGLMPVTEALAACRNVALGLQVAHEAGIIHRDLKPSNILLRPDGSAVVGDLGIAAVHFEATRLTRTGTMQGTPHYMAPEQAKAGTSVDARLDIYALGVILHELLTGSPPFDAPSPWGVIHQHISEPPPSLEKLRAGLARETYTVVSTCLKKEPGNRYQSAGEMVIALEQAIKAEKGDLVSSRKTGIPHWARYTALGIVVLIAALLLGPRLFLSPGEGIDNGSTPPAASTIVSSLPTAVVVTAAVAEQETDVAMTAASANRAPVTVGPTSTVGDGPAGGDPPIEIPTATLVSSPAPTSTPAAGQFFPNGLVAYACETSNGYQIQLTDPDTGQQIPLPNQPGNSVVPAFSPDGQRIAYRSNVGGTWQIYTSKLDGADLRMHSDNPAYDNYEAVWSPDGNQIAFVSDRTGSKQIYTMSVAGDPPARLTFNDEVNDDPSWSVEGKIAYESNVGGRYSIYVIDTAGGSEVEIVALGDSSSTPAWSPDGRRLAFEVSSGQARQIWTADRFGNDPQLVTSQGSINERPAWSPDGRYLAFHSNLQQTTANRFDIWIIDVTTRELQRITAEGDCYNPAWSPATTIPDR